MISNIVKLNTIALPVVELSILLRARSINRSNYSRFISNISSGTSIKINIERRLIS